MVNNSNQALYIFQNESNFKVHVDQWKFVMLFMNYSIFRLDLY